MPIVGFIIITALPVQAETVGLPVSRIERRVSQNRPIVAKTYRTHARDPP
jgi:hypothetical protein